MTPPYTPVRGLEWPAHAQRGSGPVIETSWGRLSHGRGQLRPFGAGVTSQRVTSAQRHGHRTGDASQAHRGSLKGAILERT